jgi:hypothetical protein
MPSKKYSISDEERAKRLRETAREIETAESHKAFDRAFKKVVRAKPESRERD